MKPKYRQMILLILAILLFNVATLTAQESSPQMTPNDPVDTSALSLPVTEIRSDVPNGKEDGRFCVIGTAPADRLEPPSSPIVVRLLATKAPLVNEAINVTLQICAFADAPGTTAEIVLPAGVETLSGSTQATFDLVAGQQAEVTTAIVFKQAGETAVTGQALHTVNPDMVWGDMDALYLTIGDKESAVGYLSGEQPLVQAVLVSDAAPASLLNEADPTSGTEDVALALAEDAAAASQVDHAEAIPPGVEENTGQSSPLVMVTLSVCWTFSPDRSGGSTPFRDAYIELRDRDTSGSADDILATGYTYYYSGCRSFTVSNVDSDQCCTIDAYFRIYTTHSGRYRVRNYAGSTFYAETSVRWNITANYNFGTWAVAAGAGNGRAFPVYDDLYRARRFIYEKAVNLGMGGDPGFVTVRWQPGGTDGNYFNPATNLVYLTDAAAGYRDIVVHEASHRYMDVVYTAWPPSDCPSPHFIQSVSGKHCAWTEGWTYVIVAGADGNPTYTGGVGFSVNLETPHCTSAGWADGPRVEGRVGGLLIDMLDPFTLSFGTVTGFSNEPDGCDSDPASGLFDEIWDTFYDQDDSVLVALDGVTNSFSNAWEARPYPDANAHTAAHHNTVGTFTHD